MPACVWERVGVAARATGAGADTGAVAGSGRFGIKADLSVGRVPVAVNGRC